MLCDPGLVEWMLVTLAFYILKFLFLIILIACSVVLTPFSHVQACLSKIFSQYSTLLWQANTSIFLKVSSTTSWSWLGGLDSCNPPPTHTHIRVSCLSELNWPQRKVHLGTYILRFTRIVDENQSSPTVHSWSSQGSCLLFPEQLNLQSNLNTQPCSYRKGQLSPLIHEPCFCSRWRPFQEVTTGQNACLHSVHLQYNI